MMRLFQQLTALISQFRIAQAGVAAVEFALVLPIMLVLYIGANEAGALISVDRRVQMVAGTLGDLVARSDSNITSDQMKEYLLGSSIVMTPFDTANLNQYVTQVYLDPADNVAKVVWSKQYVNGVYGNNPSSKRAKNQPFPLSAEMKAIMTGGSYVIVAEASYPYLPFYGLVISQTIPLYRENYFVPRFRGAITVP